MRLRLSLAGALRSQESSHHALPSRPSDSAPTLWRYREVLPLNDDANRVSLGEGFTPLLEAKTLARELGLRRLWIKDEAQNPTGSFKDRGLSMAISMGERARSNEDGDTIGRKRRRFALSLCSARRHRGLCLYA